MTDSMRWTSTLAVAWKPLLTYDRRKAELLEWFEKNTVPKAFLDDDDELGVAIGSMDQRIRVDRRSLMVQVGSRSAKPSALSDVVQGVFDIFEPSDVTLRNYRGLWSVGLDGEYGELAERLATRAAPLAAIENPSGLVAVDGAILIDLVSAEGSFQVEFGVVNPDELKMRVGRGVRRRVDAGALAPLLPLDAIPADVPSVSLYMDVYFADDEQEVLVDSAGVLRRFQAIETQVTQLAQELAGAL